MGGRRYSRRQATAILAALVCAAPVMVAHDAARAQTRSGMLDRITREPLTDSGGLIVSKAQRTGFGVRVTSGLPAPEEQHIFAIRFLNRLGEEQLCTGTLLDRRHVLTAGHCACGIPASYSLSNSPVVPPVGAGPRRGDYRALGAPITFDPAACEQGSRFGRDLALIKLASDAAEMNKDNDRQSYWWSDVERQIQPRSTRLIVIGYGRTEKGETGQRMQAEVPPITTNCRERNWWPYCMPFAEMMLGEPGTVQPRDTCGGDSGGPVLMEVLAPDPKFGNALTRVTALVGVTSRAAPFDQPLANGECGGGGIYTAIGRFSVARWLADNGVKFAFEELPTPRRR